LKIRALLAWKLPVVSLEKFRLVENRLNQEQLRRKVQLHALLQKSNLRPGDSAVQRIKT
jgi:hypothetical protein